MTKRYSMRLNIYLDENETKDNILINFLNKKYSPVGFTKEILYALATGEVVQSDSSIQSDIIEQSLDQADQQEKESEYEPIKGTDDIEL